MGHNDHIDLDDEVTEIIQELIDENHFDETKPSFGIAKQVKDRGEESLSPKQREIYQAQIEPAVRKRLEQYEMNRKINSAPK